MSQADIKLSAEDEAELARLKQSLETSLDTSDLKTKLEAQIQKQLEQVWESQLKDKCMELLRQQPLDQVNMDQITSKLIEFGKDKIPTEVKNNAYNEIKNFLEKQKAYTDFINK